MIEDFERCYRAVQSRDGRFDGWFFTAVSSTGIYCRPSCPAMTPKRTNVSFHQTAAAAQRAGYRACKRCRPDATPGSPEWNVRADVVARAMRLIADGVVDRDGVAGLAHRLAYSERHLNRLLTAEVGAGPLALARAQRAQTARVLIETTPLRFTEIAFAAGFASVRQFNDTVRDVFAATPTQMRRRARPDRGAAPGAVSLRLPYREPYHPDEVLRFLGVRAIPGVEQAVTVDRRGEVVAHTRETTGGDAGTPPSIAGGDADGRAAMQPSDCAAYRRTLRLPHGAGVVVLSGGEGHVVCRLRLDDLRDLTTAVQRCRRLLDLDADPVAVDDALATDPLLAPIVRWRPGRRVPGTGDAHELAIRAVIGQQVSVAGARTLAGRLAQRYGKPLTAVDGALTHTFPEAAALADADPADLPMPASRRRALRGLAAALASGEVQLDGGADRVDVEHALLALPGIGPWTAAYVAMRALGDPDAFPGTDLGLRRAVERLGRPGDPRSVAAMAERWRPWRAYATQYLWSSLDLPTMPPPAAPGAHR